MLTELSSPNKVVGAKQVRRALLGGQADKVFIAADADPRVTEPIALLAEEKGVATREVLSMRELGRACGVPVPAALAALLRGDA